MQRELKEGTPKGVPSRVKIMEKTQLQNWIEEYLQGTDYELITLSVSAANDILVEVDRLAGVDVDFCADLNRFLVEKIEADANANADYSLEVGSVSLTDPFKTKMQFEKNLGHDVEVLVEGKKRKETQIVTHTWRYDEPKYVKYDLKI